MAGALDFQGLMDLYNNGGIGSYLDDEFGLDSSYTKYITPVNFAQQNLARASLDSLQGFLQDIKITGLKENELSNQTAYQKSGLLKSGEIDRKVKDAKTAINLDFDKGYRSASFDTAGAILSDQQRQVENFYSDVGSISQFKQGQENSGGKK